MKICDFSVDPIKKHGLHDRFPASANLPFFIFSSETNRPMGTKLQEIIIGWLTFRYVSLMLIGFSTWPPSRIILWHGTLWEKNNSIIWKWLNRIL